MWFCWSLGDVPDDALLFIYLSIQEFEEGGDPEKHFQALLSLAKEGMQKGKVRFLLVLFIGQ